MTLTKCDLCKKIIKGMLVSAGVGFFRSTEFCVDCGAPVLDFLKKHKLIDKENKPVISKSRKLTI